MLRVRISNSALVFTVAALDIADHILSSRTSKRSFHGTGISRVQFFTKENEGISREIPMCLPTLLSQKASLLESFTCVPKIYFNKMSSFPDLLTSTTKFCGIVKPAKAKENGWIECVLSFTSS